MDQRTLTEKITEMLRRDERIRGAWLGGSYGRKDADAFSDVDVFALVAADGDKHRALTDHLKKLQEVEWIIYVKVLPSSQTINAITREWLRFDLTFVSRSQLSGMARGQLIQLFDYDEAGAAITGTQVTTTALSATQLIEVVNEFLRVIGLTPVVVGRDEILVGQTGFGIMRELLIKIMLAENSRPLRGLLSLSRNLTDEQVQVLKALPLPAPNWPSILNATRAIAGEFFPRARRLAVKLNAEWPEARRCRIIPPCPKPPPK